MTLVDASVAISIKLSQRLITNEIIERVIGEATKKSRNIWDFTPPTHVSLYCKREITLTNFQNLLVAPVLIELQKATVLRWFREYLASRPTGTVHRRLCLQLLKHSSHDFLHRSMYG